jgi:hypothetical protein
VRGIRVVDKAGDAGFTWLEYAALDAEPSFWRGFPMKGRVLAAMCQSCGRISLYGAPYAEKPNKGRRSKKRGVESGELSLAEPSDEGGLSPHKK